MYLFQCHKDIKIKITTTIIRMFFVIVILNLRFPAAGYCGPCQNQASSLTTSPWVWLDENPVGTRQIM